MHNSNTRGRDISQSENKDGKPLFDCRIKSEEVGIIVGKDLARGRKPGLPETDDIRVKSERQWDIVIKKKAGQSRRENRMQVSFHRAGVELAYYCG